MVDNTSKPPKHLPATVDEPADSTVFTSRTNESFSLPFDTAIAPSFPGVFRSDVKASPNVPDGPPELTESDGHFEVIRELGRGASGVVYLARQVALNRQVALKVTYNVGTEAQTMANLEHPNVVQVFSETLSKDGQLRLICMQYVAGITLADLIARLRSRNFDELDGLTIIELIADAMNSAIPEDVDVDSLKKQSYVETVCRLGIDMARALEHSHRQAVIHRDIKPANVLINRMGRPLLADFSLSLESVGGSRAGSSVFGGTLAYMAPEHLDALRPASGVNHDVVDERSDIYSLGLVLHELISLDEQPVADASRPLDKVCQRLADHRRTAQFEFVGDQGRIGLALDWTLRQCLQANPADRFQRVREIVDSLEGCETLTHVIKNLPTNRWTRALETSPAIALFFVGLVPNAIAIAVGVAYAHSSPRMANISDQGLRAFQAWCVAHAIVGSVFMFAVIVSNLRKWMPRAGMATSSVGDARFARRGLLRAVSVAMFAEFIVWLPGLLVIPGFVYKYQQVKSIDLLVEITFGYALVMLVAASLTYFVVAFVAVRVGYPFLWDDVRNIRTTAAKELCVFPRRLRLFHWLAGAMPLVGAISLILAGSESFQASGLFSFRMLGIGLIVGGLLGLVAIGAVRASIERTIKLFSGKNA